jgi:hypothetical protein
MQSPIKSPAAGRGGRLSIAVVWTVCLTGCCGGILTSARYAPPVPHPATVPTAAAPAAPVDSASTVDAGCVIPPEGYCGADDCPPLLTWPRGVWARCLGPLFHRRGEAGQTAAEAEVEAELYPPHSRFHPVPTAPAFAQRYDYEPPERMMEPIPARPRFAPQALPHVPDVQPLPTPAARGPAIEAAPSNPPPGDAVPEPILPGPQQDEKASREPRSVLLLKR